MAKTQPQAPDLDSFSERFRKESDRACAVLGAALVDARLESLFWRRLGSDHKELLASARPLGSFSSRIRLARALGWITEQIRRDLDTIREIRNDFAHSFDHELSFAHPTVIDRCNALRVARALHEGFDSAAEKSAGFSPQAIRAMQAVFAPPRSRFEITVEFIAQHLDELEDQSPTYSGPDLLQQSYDIGAKTRPVMSMQVDTAPGSSSGEG